MGRQSTDRAHLLRRKIWRCCLRKGTSWDATPSAIATPGKLRRTCSKVKSFGIAKRSAKLAPRATFKTFSYPISVPRAQTKQRISKYFACCRCGGQTFNVGNVDLNYLSAFFLEQSRDNPEIVKSLIDQNRRARGWLIFATHDISDDPTNWGCTPEFFEEIVRYAVNSGARILPALQAYELLRTKSSSWGTEENATDARLS